MIAHRRLGGNLALARALRLRLLSEAVIEQVDDSVVDLKDLASGSAGEALRRTTVETLLLQLAPYVGASPSPTARHHVILQHYFSRDCSVVRS
jgi:hypothetical protein